MKGIEILTMNFNDKIEELGYFIREKNREFIIIEQKERISDIVILFGIKDRVIAGYLRPNNVIQDLDDITHQYTVFRKMEKDLKELSELSHYAII